MHQEVKEETDTSHCPQASIPCSQVEGVVGAANVLITTLLPDSWPAYS